MKTKFITIAASLLFAVQALAVHVTISVQGSNIVLRWPSRTNEVFVIGYRTALDPTHPWTLLSTNYLASMGGQTTYVVTNVVPLQSFSGGGSGGAGGPPGFNSAASSGGGTTARSSDMAARAAAAQERMEKDLKIIMPPPMQATKSRDFQRRGANAASSVALTDGQTTSQPSSSVTASSVTQGFFMVSELGEDADADGLPTDLELAMALSPFTFDANGNGVDDGHEDYDGDGIANADELVAGSDPLVADNFVAHLYLTSGYAIRDEFTAPGPITPPGFASLAPPVSAQLAAYGNDDDGIAGMFARVQAADGTIQMYFYSVFVEGSFFLNGGPVAANESGLFGLTPSELQQLGPGYGPGTRSRNGFYSTPNLSKLQQVPTQTLQKAEQLHAYRAKQFWIQANSPNISAVTRRIKIDQVDTQVSRLNAVRRAQGRAGQALLPLSIIGGVMVAVDIYGSQQQLIDAARAYHSAAASGDDVCDPALDVAIWGQTVAPPSGNWMYAYLCPN